MGEEITTSHFTKDDFMRFKKRLQDETEELRGWFSGRRFSSHKPVAGYEMEAWLIDKQSGPASCNERFLKVANTPLYTAELAQFNIELNATPANIGAKFLSEFESDLQQHWLYCKSVAEGIGCRVLSTGILQTLCDADLSINNISNMLRYKALNEQVLLQRQGRPLYLNINGHQSLKSEHHNVMLEAAATSLDRKSVV